MKQNRTLILTLDLMINYELERFILSYANSVKVIHPKKLCSQIKKRLLNAGNF